MPKKRPRSVSQQAPTDPMHIPVPPEVVDGVKRVYRQGWRDGWKAGFAAGQQYYRLEVVEKDDERLGLE